MNELAEVHTGQTVEWYDVRFGGRVTGTVEHVSVSTGWVTVKLNGPHPVRPRSDRAHHPHDHQGRAAHPA